MDSDDADDPAACAAVTAAATAEEGDVGEDDEDDEDEDEDESMPDDIASLPVAQQQGAISRRVRSASRYLSRLRYV
jgi:hypothetical protein